jgi:aryl-alcohol dehydrogenase-like predicted oxidoreductase
MLSAERLVLGTVQWGMPYGVANRTGVPEDRAILRMLARAREVGITTLDTARAYGVSETTIGRLVGDDEWWHVVTKVPPLKLEGKSAGEADAAARDAVKASLAALRRSRLDALLLHDPTDRTAASGAAWHALLELRGEGVIGTLGISARNPPEALRALDVAEVEVIQVATNLLDERLIRARFFEHARAKGKRVFVRSAFLQGVAHISPETLPSGLLLLQPVLASIRGWARDRHMTVGEMFLLYLRDTQDAPIVLGIETDEQLAANLTTWARPPIARDTWSELSRIVPELPEAILDPSKWRQG